MKRRDLSLVAACMFSSRAWAQSPMPAIGFLNPTSPDTYAFTAIAFRTGLKEAGYVDGENCRIVYRWGRGAYDRLPVLATELVNEKVAAIAATGDVASARAAQAATSTIPIVFTIGADPVRFGLVASMARPGGNTTGISLLSAVLSAKRVQILKELAPRIDRIGLLMNPDNYTAEAEQRDAEVAAASLAATTLAIAVRTAQDIDEAFGRFVQEGMLGFVVATDPFLINRRTQIIELAERNRMAGIYPVRQFVDSGGLVSYGPSLSWMYRQAGRYVGRILRGARPAEMPVLQPTEFELAINVKAAESLDIGVPPAMAVLAELVAE